MYRTFKTLFTAFLLATLLTPNLSLAVRAQAPPLRGNFRVVLTGFRVNHQTADDILERDGAGDEVTFIHKVVMVDNAGGLRQIIGASSFTTPMGQTPVNSLRAGTATDRGGLRTGDLFPTTTPWALTTTPTVSGIPASILFEGELVQRRDALVLMPTVWEWDGSRELQGPYAAALNAAHPAIARAASGMLSTSRSLNLNDWLLPGSALGIGNTATLGRGFAGLGDPKNRPIGMTVLGGGFGFTPQALVLTYDVAREFARRDFGHGRGVIEVHYKENDDHLQGDYSLFVKIENQTDVSPACAPLTATFDGDAELTTTHPDVRLQGPFPAHLHFAVQLSECRSVLSIPSFPRIPVRVDTGTVFGIDDVTVSRTDTSVGTRNASTGRLTLPITLQITHSQPVGPSTITMTLTTDGGMALDSSGHFTLTGGGRFSGGIFDHNNGRVVVRNGTLSPAP